MWTRNYKNLIATNLAMISRGYSGTSPSEFGGKYSFNFKDSSGQIREFCTQPASNNNGFGGSLVPFVVREMNGLWTTSFDILTNQTSIPSVSTAQFHSTFIGFGSSEAEESELDYALKEEISNIKRENVTVEVTSDDDGTITLDCKVVISATADITIREIGLFKPVVYGYSTYNNYGKLMLCNRIVLDSPISVASGEVATVTFSVTMPKVSFN